MQCALGSTIYMEVREYLCEVELIEKSVQNVSKGEMVRGESDV